MTNQEILTKAIEKAASNGCNVTIDKSDTGRWIVFGHSHTLLDGAVPTELIFNHDFAKALWGEQKRLENGEYPPTVVLYKGKPMWHPWKYHLQQMVIAEDPIKYLGEHI